MAHPQIRPMFVRRTLLLAAAMAGVLTLGAGALVAGAAPAAAADTATINGATTYQTIAGFGASEAFGQAQTVMDASSPVQQQALGLLYSPSSGAGLTILRNEISADSGSTIEPAAPSSPTAWPRPASSASVSPGPPSGGWLTNSACAYSANRPRSAAQPDAAAARVE